MQDQLKAIRSESKGKTGWKVSTATDELQYLIDFNSSITQAVAKTMEHLTNFVFVSVGNLTLARRDSNLSHLKAGVKTDTLAALPTAPLQLATLFPDNILRHAEEGIAKYEDRGHSSCGKGRTTPMNNQIERLRKVWLDPHGKTASKSNSKKDEGRSMYYSLPAKGQQLRK